MEKLARVGESGYTISSDETNELIQWNKLRNMLTHVPPEDYHPVAIDGLDAKEYSDLLTTISRRWEGQRHETYHCLKPTAHVAGAPLASV